MQVRSVTCQKPDDKEMSCDPTLKPINTQSCSTGITCMTNSQETFEHPKDYSETQNDDPAAYSFNSNTDSLKSDFFMEQRIPNEATYVSFLHFFLFWQD